MASPFDGAAQSGNGVRVRVDSAGGPISRLAPLFTRGFPTKAVPITLGAEGKRRTLVIPGIADITVEGIIGAGDGEVWLDNVGHFASRRLAAAKGNRVTVPRSRAQLRRYRGNGHYSAIDTRPLSGRAAR